jgi:hypothetical protein
MFIDNQIGDLGAYALAELLNVTKTISKLKLECIPCCFTFFLNVAQTTKSEIQEQLH